jgi:hypothetical protein
MDEHFGSELFSAKLGTIWEGVNMRREEKQIYINVAFDGDHLFC